MCPKEHRAGNAAGSKVVPGVLRSLEEVAQSPNEFGPLPPYIRMIDAPSSAMVESALSVDDSGARGAGELTSPARAFPQEFLEPPE
jgi:hypothetical protein